MSVEKISATGKQRVSQAPQTPTRSRSHTLVHAPEHTNTNVSCIHAFSARPLPFHPLLTPSPELCIQHGPQACGGGGAAHTPGRQGWINTFVDRWALPPSGQHACSPPFAVLRAVCHGPAVIGAGCILDMHVLFKRLSSLVLTAALCFQSASGWTPTPAQVRSPASGACAVRGRTRAVFCLTRKTARVHTGCAFACRVAQERASHGAALVARGRRGEICRCGRGGRRREQGARSQRRGAGSPGGCARRGEALRWAPWGVL
jgi:hypothetical protein